MRIFISDACCPVEIISGKDVKRDSVTDVVSAINQFSEGTRAMVTCPLKIPKGRMTADELNLLLSKGFTRMVVHGEVKFIEDLLSPPSAPPGGKKKSPAKAKKVSDEFEILIDRATVNASDEDLTFRLSDSVQTAFFEGQGDCFIHAEGRETLQFSDRFELDGMTFTEPSVNFFSFNNPFGACRTCEGFGKLFFRSWQTAV